MIDAVKDGQGVEAPQTGNGGRERERVELDELGLRSLHDVRGLRSLRDVRGVRGVRGVGGAPINRAVRWPTSQSRSERRRGRTSL